MLQTNRSIVTSGFAVLCGLVMLCPGLAQSQAGESDPITWSEVRTDVSALQEQDKIDEALSLLEARAAELKNHDFDVSDLTLEILFGAGRVEEALAVWGRGP